ncbi:MAG: hypothetical protein HY673_00870 [Chloroflexi bacterium]|nr:hypothetical protein [Chloroflexota bacterium]
MENSQTPIVDGVPGWRGVFGWICPSIPSSSWFLELQPVLPEGIDIKISTLDITVLTDEEVERALARVDSAAVRLAAIGATFISVLGIMPFMKGFGFDKEIIRRVEEVARVRVTTDPTASVAALQALDLKKVVMVSPMAHEVDRRTKVFFEDSGFEIIHVKSLNLINNKDIHLLPRSTAYTVARQAFKEAPQAQGIYMACGAWCPPWVIDRLERDLGVPVLHSRQVVTWAGLKSLHVKERVKGWGRLFETL